MGLYSFIIDHWGVLLTSALGLLAIYLLLPRPRRFPILWGAAAGAVALLLLGWLVLRVNILSLESALFYLFAFIAIVSGVLLITVTNPARAAISFALVILSTCGLFLLQAAPFLMAATIIVYAGAIIVTFLFVLMLAQQHGPSDADARTREPMLASITGFVLLVALLSVLSLTWNSMEPYLSRVQHSVLEARRMLKEKAPAEERAALVKTTHEEITTFRDWWEKKTESKNPRENDPAKGLKDALFNAEFELGDLQKKDDLTDNDLVKMEQFLVVVWDLAAVQQGQLRPTYLQRKGNDAGSKAYVAELSETSGPRSSRGASEFRRDPQGVPHLPAQNPAYLGRSIFSDYLLAVELGGLLLLVATVGAIAIAARRQTGEPQTDLSFSERTTQ